MRRVSVPVPLYLPDGLYRLLKAWKNKLMATPVPAPSQINLLGDRDIENSWITSQMPSGSGEALDFGAGYSFLGLVAAQCGYNVTALNLEPVKWAYVHPRLRFVQGDILTASFPENQFQLIINCSTVEHVGLAGRYGVTDLIPDGDLDAMLRLSHWLKRDGVMLLTIPVGIDAVFMPLCRVYGETRLPRLLNEFSVEKEAYWAKDDSNRWNKCDRSTALRFEASAGSWDPMQNKYALGCFVLKSRAGK